MRQVRPAVELGHRAHEVGLGDVPDVARRTGRRRAPLRADLETAAEDRPFATTTSNISPPPLRVDGELDVARLPAGEHREVANR